MASPERADHPLNRTDPQVRRSHLVPEVGLAGVLGQERLVIDEHPLEQLPAQALKPGRVEQHILADSGEEVVDGPAGQQEVALGPVLRPAGPKHPHAGPGDAPQTGSAG